LCASFQEAIVEVLVKKTLKAAQEHQLTQIVVGGGVAANRRLRAVFKKESENTEMSVFLPDLSFCTDNAAMIASAGYYKLKHARRGGRRLVIDANLPVQSWGAGR
jgi:N6-L-threonylcarbamoyladenine synthase